MEAKSLTPFLSVGPQPTLDELKSLRHLGFHGLISNRPDGEEPGQPSASEVAATSREQGLKFLHIPVPVGKISDEAAAQFAAALESLRGPVFAFCKSGTRSAMLWALTQAARLDPEAIVQTAAKVGYDLGKLKPKLDGLWSAGV